MALDPVLGCRFPVKFTAFFFLHPGLVLLDFSQLHLPVDFHLLSPPFPADAAFPDFESFLEADLALLLPAQEGPAGLDGADL
jgi:hypothetical protein